MQALISQTHSGNYTHHLLHRVKTRLNFPTQYFCLRSLQSTTASSPHNTDRLLSVMEAECLLRVWKYVIAIFCCDRRRYWPVYYTADPGSILGQPKWDLWWMNWHWNELFSQYFFGFLSSVSLHLCYIIIFILIILRSFLRSSSLILVWPLWVRIPENLPTKVVNCVDLCTVCV